MLLTNIFTECIHVFLEVVASALFLFKVNFDLMDVFLLFFDDLLALGVGPNHSVHDSQY